MSLVIGPILKQRGGYAFDSWLPGRGVRQGYCYNRIEDAAYAQKHAIADAVRETGSTPVICRTSDEFALKVGGSWAQAAAA